MAIALAGDHFAFAGDHFALAGDHFAGRLEMSVYIYITVLKVCPFSIIWYGV